MSGCLPRLIRIMIALALLAMGLAGHRQPTESARAANPAITVTPTSAAPHGSVQISGSGFDQTVTVTFSLTTSGGATTLGTAQTDGSGTIAAQQFTLPFTLDAPGPNQITATESGASNARASTSLTGVALQPQLNGGQPLSAVPGGQLDLKGSGFAPNDTVTVSLNGTTLSAGGQSTVAADGTGAVDIPLVVPASSAFGTETLMVTGSAKGNGQHDQASVQVTISNGFAATPGAATPIASPTAASPGGLQISPNPAAVGTTIKVSAGGFQPNEPVTFTLHYFDTSLNDYAVENSPATADSSGVATALINIPGSANGSKPGSVSARGITSGVTLSAPLTFSQLASLSISPSTALPGATLVVSGTGFVPNEALFVTTRLFKPPVGHFAVVDASGHFSATVTLLGTVQPGAALDLAVSGSGGDNATVSFTVARPLPPTVTVNPATAGPGTAVTVTGTGYYANEGLTFAAGFTTLAASGAPRTDNTGSFTATIMLAPSLALGATTVKVTGAISAIAASNTVTIAPTLYFAEGFTGQGPSAFFQETLSLLNAGSASVTGTITYMLSDGTTRARPITIPARSLLQENVNKDLGPNQIVSAMVQTNQPIMATRTIARAGKAKHPLDDDSSPGVTTPQTTWYFAEGYSGVSFQPYLVLQNPSTVPVTATVTLFVARYPAKIVTVNLPSYGRATLNLRGVLLNRSFSTRVNATSPVVAERVEYWGAGAGSAKYGAGAKPGIAGEGKTWYFAYASVLGGDQAYLSLFDPHTVPAHVQVVFFNGTGQIAGSTKLTVGPGQRSTVAVNTYVGARHSPVAAIVSSDRDLVAEEAQYIGGSPNTGAHAGTAIEGRQATATRWSFADGNTAADQETEYLFNPSHKAIAVTGTFYGADHQVLSATYPVPPLTVISVSANALKKLHAGAHGSVWTSKGAFVAALALQGKKDHTMSADEGIPG